METNLNTVIRHLELLNQDHPHPTIPQVIARLRMEQQNHKVVVVFDNRKAAEHFQYWLCGQGEQDYWLWMESRECDEDGDITATSFDYDHHALTIEGKCGRLDK